MWAEMHASHSVFVLPMYTSSGTVNAIKPNDYYVVGYKICSSSSFSSESCQGHMGAMHSNREHAQNTSTAFASALNERSLLPISTAACGNVTSINVTLLHILLL